MARYYKDAAACLGPSTLFRPPFQFVSLHPHFRRGWYYQIVVVITGRYCSSRRRCHEWHGSNFCNTIVNRLLSPAFTSHIYSVIAGYFCFIWSWQQRILRFCMRTENYSKLWNKGKVSRILKQQSNHATSLNLMNIWIPSIIKCIPSSRLNCSGQ